MKRLLALTASAVLIGGSTAELCAQDLTVNHVRIVVGTGQVIEQGTIVVRNGRIASVGAGGGAAGAQTIDARGLTAMPGYIDAHRHIIGGNSDQWFKEQATVRMQEFLEAGYTTLMSGGGPVPGIVQLQERTAKGVLKGPRIVTSGRADPDNFKTPDDARAQVRMLKQAGVEIIKARIEPPAVEEQLVKLRAVTDEAKKQNLGVMVHAVSPRAMVEAVKAGATKLVHTPHNGYVTAEQAKFIKDSGIEMLSTIGFGVPVFGVFNKDNKPTFRDGKPWPGGMEGVGNDGREAGEKAVNARMLWDAGVTYGFGTDTGYHPKDGLSHELRALNLMFSPIDIVKLMGPNTAAFLDKTSELGTLEPGKFADIVLLAGNPLEGYWNLLNPKVVIKGGEVVVDKR